jgi:nitrite reductase (NO-forming)
MKQRIKVFALILLVALLASACGQSNQQNKVSYELKTALADGKMVFIGVGGDIDGVTNPTLKAKVGDIVTIKLVSGEGAEHNFAMPDFNVDSQHVSGQGNSITVVFGVDKGGSFPYFCNLPGHRQAGMEGVFVVDGPTAVAPTMGMDSSASASTQVAAPATTSASDTGVDISRDPTDLPAPLTDSAPTTRRIDLVAQEVKGQLADGVTFDYWTFNGKVPGPFFRVRVGDTVEVHLKNDPSSVMSHSVDFHAVTGPGGGAVFTTTAPGGETMFTFKALVPGLYVYHCATPMVAEHIANGMYGMILVEPEGGLPKVDREFYVMQGEIYTTGKFGAQGMQMPDIDKLLNETPEYYVLNGAVGALTTNHPLKAKVGETVRIFFGVGGPNKTSSFHVIGEMFDRVYNLGSVMSAPLTDVQTTMVPPGGATIVEFGLQVPGRYILVDHALSRMQRGLAGYLLVDGPAVPDIFNGTPMPGSGH